MLHLLLAAALLTAPTVADDTTDPLPNNNPTGCYATLQQQWQNDVSALNLKSATAYYDKFRACSQTYSLADEVQARSAAVGELWSAEYVATWYYLYAHNNALGEAWDQKVYGVFDDMKALAQSAGDIPLARFITEESANWAHNHLFLEEQS